MRSGYVHEASLRLDGDADAQGPGAAVTVELCGHWEHEGPCRWPHASAIAARSGDELTLRVVFAADPGDEGEVRARIARGLRRGGVEGGPRPSSWTLLAEHASGLRPDEVPLAERLVSL